VIKSTNRIRPVHLAWGISLLFFLAGQAFITRAGVEADEALIFSPLLEPREAVYLRLFHHPFPVLLMSYLGTLKTLIYNPILHIFGNSLWALREPVLLAGAATIGLFFLILRRASGDRAALIGCGILATDSIYLITNCNDWRPVALQHLLLLGGTLLALRFCENKKLWPLAGAFFLCGLALWDKALSIWMLSSMGLAAVLIFPRYLVALTTRRRVAIALLAFILGGFPLLRFNLKTHWSTFRGNFTRDQHFYRKVPYFLNTLDGEGLFGWMMPFPKDQAPAPHVPDSHLTAVSAEISSLAGHPRHNLMLYAFALALLLAPLARGNALRAILFALIAMAVAWAQMAVTANAGASVHHAILLWPFPEMVIAVSFAAASRRLGRAGIPSVAAVLRLAIPQAGPKPFPRLAANNRIDELVYNKLKAMGVPPSPLATDEAFLRRVYLDAIGTLPTAEEARRIDLYAAAFVETHQAEIGAKRIVLTHVGDDLLRNRARVRLHIARDGERFVI